MSTSTVINWKELVERVDGPDRHRDNLYPVVFVFTNGRVRRDSGPESGVYEKP